jgi:ATP-dependent DNA helicase
MVSFCTTGADTESQKSTPASSPPPVDMEGVSNGVSKEMQVVEEQMRLKHEKDDLEREQKMEKERQEDLKGGKEVLDAKFKALEHLLSKSKVGLCFRIHSFERIRLRF